MGLATCPNCQNTIDGTAASCPFCGTEFAVDPMQALADAARGNAVASGRRSTATRGGGGGGFQCGNCGYRGRAKRKRAGSIIVMIFLLCIMVLPGLLYAIFYGGFIYVCPRCGLKLGDAS